MNLDGRIARIEAQLGTGGRRRVTRKMKEEETAAGICYEALASALPDDGLIVIYNPDDPPAFTGRIYHSEKRKALADRIIAGTTSESDNMVLNAIPESALQILGMTAAEFVVLVQITLTVIRRRI
jgi:hypothetical protein